MIGEYEGLCPCKPCVKLQNRVVVGLNQARGKSGKISGKEALNNTICGLTMVVKRRITSIS
jgi:hypothetical protein